MSIDYEEIKGRKMDQLPVEINLKIFSQLDLADLMALRLVCKKFVYIVKEVKIRELIFAKDFVFWKMLYLSSFSYKLKDQAWFFVNNLKEFGSVFSFTKYFLANSCLPDGPFNVRFLKRLSIELLSDVNGIGLEEINRFDRLEHLEIGFDQRQPHKSASTRLDEQVNEVPRLSLPNLKCLRIVIYANQTGLEIDAPKLTALQLPKWADDMCDLSSLQFTHPKSIKFLSIQNYLKRENYLAQFDELEFLEINNLALRIDDERGLTFPETISNFAKLKQLNLLGEMSIFMWTQIYDVVQQALAMGKNGLRVFYLGVDLSTSSNFLNHFLFYHRARIGCRAAIDKDDSKGKTLFGPLCWPYELTIQFKNYSILKQNLDSHYEIDYDLLVNSILPELVQQGNLYRTERTDGYPQAPNGLPMSSFLPGDFFERYPKIVKINATNRIEDEEHFTQFVKDCKNLMNLKLENTQLSEAFVDELPSISLLSFLEIQEDADLNMNFLRRMNRLGVCIVNQPLSSEIVLKLAKTRYCGKLACKIKGRSVTIRRNGKDKYLFSIGSVNSKFDYVALAEHLANF